MGEQLDENVLSYARRTGEPTPHTIARRQIVAGYLTLLNPWYESLGPPDSERAGDHQQVLRQVTRLQAFSPIVRFGLGRIVHSPVNLIDRPRLRRRVTAGHREVGIATQFLAQGNLVIQAAPASARGGIVQRPVAVNEAEPYLAFVFAKKPVFVKQRIQ